MAEEPRTCCGYQITLMKQIGAWPLETESSSLMKVLQISFRCFTIIVLVVASICLVGATLFSEDLREVSSTVDIATLTISALYKIAFTTYYMKRFTRLVQFMNAKFKKAVYNKNGDRISAKEECKRCNLYSTLLVLSGALTIAFYCVTPLLEEEKVGRMENGNWTTHFTAKRYPLHFWLPFNPDSSPMYEVVYFVQSYSLFLSAHIYLVMDSFFFTVVYQICVQMRMLYKIMLNLGNGNFDYDHDDDDDGKGSHMLAHTRQSNTTDLNVPSQKSANSKYIENVAGNMKNNKMRTNEYASERKYNTKEEYSIDDEMDAKLKRCVVFHADLLRIIEELECLYRSMILADVLHAIISLSFALHETGVSESIYDRIKMYLFLIICIVHQFLNSHYGEQLLNVQEDIRESIYMSSWINQNPRYRQLIVMMILRSQKCTILNGGKMYHLCRQSFVLFTKTMFSYYMVLRQSSE